MAIRVKTHWSSDLSLHTCTSEYLATIHRFHSLRHLQSTPLIKRSVARGHSKSFVPFASLSLPKQSTILPVINKSTGYTMAAASTPQPISLTRSLSNIDTPVTADVYCNTNCTEETNEPLVKFGVITDIQYADLPNRPAWYDASKTRYYRASLDHVKQAFDHWTSTDSCLFALQLG